jgi:hypothetical protein
METQYATGAAATRSRRSARAITIGLIGPVTMLGGVVWAFVQPYRLTLLHPHGVGFWWLLSEPPLFVILVGLGFATLVAPGLRDDLEEAEDAPTG